MIASWIYRRMPYALPLLIAAYTAVNLTAVVVNVLYFTGASVPLGLLVANTLFGLFSVMDLVIYLARSPRTARSS